jgi:hypothetical protein
MSPASETHQEQYDILEQNIEEAIEGEFRDGDGNFEAVIENNETRKKVELDYEQRTDEHGKNVEGELSLKVYDGGDVIEQRHTSFNVITRKGTHYLFEKDQSKGENSLKSVLEETIEFSGGIASHVRPKRLSRINNLDENLRIRYFNENYDELPIDNSEETEAWKKLKQNLHSDSTSNPENMEEVREKLEDPYSNDIVLNITYPES